MKFNFVYGLVLLIHYLNTICPHTKNGETVFTPNLNPKKLLKYKNEIPGNILRHESLKNHGKQEIIDYLDEMFLNKTRILK